MTTGLAWLDTSREEQRRMRELLNLFTETESRDELGIGQVRDAFSDLLFPGTSTLHTRARYLLIVPWCYVEAQKRGLAGARLEAQVDHNQRRLIKTLRDAGQTDGLIGRVAGVSVKTLPSTIYWGALGQYGIRTHEDPGAAIPSAGNEATELADRVNGDWAPTLPAVPRGFPTQLDGGLELTRPEAAWLRERMRIGAPATALTYSLHTDHRPNHDSRAPWEDVQGRQVPSILAEQLQHAELFSLAMHGAALLYNLLLAELYEHLRFTAVEEPVRVYRASLREWSEEASVEHRWQGWDRSAMWSSVIGQNARIGSNMRARAFVDAWLDAVISGEAMQADASQALSALVGERERSVKRTQSRLGNERLLRDWSGRSGTSRLTFRWSQVRRLLLDVHQGLERDDAAS